MNELTGPRFNLPYNRFISIKVQAYNIRGWSVLSQINTVGVYAEVVPSALLAPTNGPLTTETQINIKWVQLQTQSQIGGATCTIYSYNL